MARASESTGPLGEAGYFLLRRLHSLTGLIFGGYLIVHLVVNATIAQMGDIYQLQVDQIHRLPLLRGVEWAFIFLPIIYHTVYGTWIILTGQPNVNHYPYIRNWLYTLQRISAVILVLFILFHVLTLKFAVAGAGSPLTFDPHNAAASVHRHMQYAWWVSWLIYPIGIVASCYHLANGFWAAAITWGVTISAGAQRRFGYVCGGLFVLTMVLGFTALIASQNPKLAQGPKAGVITAPNVSATGH